MADETEKLSLPGSGYEVITKILHAYALCGEKPASLDDVASKAGMDKTIVSRNNGFLSSLGLLEGGKSKTLTAIGRQLAVALGHDLAEDAAIAWQRAFTISPAGKTVLDVLRVHKAIPAEQLPGRIATALGTPDSAATKTGLNTIIEILKTSALIREADGKYSLVATSTAGKEDTSFVTPAATTPTAPAIATSTTPKLPTLASIPINVNIELHLPSSSEQAVYDALFKSIKENLLS